MNSEQCTLMRRITFSRPPLRRDDCANGKCGHNRNETSFVPWRQAANNFLLLMRPSSPPPPLCPRPLSGNSVFARNGRRRFTNYHLILFFFGLLSSVIRLIALHSARASNGIDNKLGHRHRATRTHSEVRQK